MEYSILHGVMTPAGQQADFCRNYF